MDTRKSLPRIAFERIYHIDRAIASGRYPNVPYLAQKCKEWLSGREISESTINRDISYMKLMLNAPIEYDFKHKGYYYSEKSFHLPAGFATAEEFLTLGITKNLLTLYKNTPLYDTAHTLMDVITAPLAASCDVETDGKRNIWYEERIIVPQPASSPIVPELWNVIIAGLRENRIISFDYKGVIDEDYHNRKVHPWQLLFDNGAWLLYAYSVERKDVRMFALSRMKNAAITETKFTLPKNYQYDNRTGKDAKGNVVSQSYFGVFRGDRILHYRIALYGPAVFIARERTWAADQKIKIIDNGIIMSFTSCQTDKVLEWVLARGGYACPLEPPELVDKWKNNLKGMNKLSKKFSL